MIDILDDACRTRVRRILESAPPTDVESTCAAGAVEHRWIHAGHAADAG